MFPKNLNNKLEQRKQVNALRALGKNNTLIDFSSNDYLGFSNSESIYNASLTYLKELSITRNGATGSRLLSGNHELYTTLETVLCEFHNSEAALVFNSGYTANLGFFSCVPQRNDIILYDELVHASIRDGITMSNAKAYKFKHNNLEQLDEMLKQVKQNNTEVYVVTESVFSMDGDTPNLAKLSEVCEVNSAHLVIDEAHALGVFGKQGQGLVQDLNLEAKVFARIITFGKAIGCHGAAILGSKQLISFLVNFSRPFIYTTALAPHAVASVICAYKELYTSNSNKTLQEIISYFNTELIRLGLKNWFIKSNSAIHCCIIPDNTKVKSVARLLQEGGFDVKPILSPTVEKGKERLRFCLHSFNSEQEIKKVLTLLSESL